MFKRTHQTLSQALPTRGSPAGFSLIELMIGVAVLMVLAAITLPLLTQAVKAANEAAAIAHMRHWSSAQELYHHKYGVYANSDQKLVDEGLVSASDRSGYSYNITPLGPMAWSGTASPIVPEVTGDRYFYIGTDGVIRWALGAPADAGSPALNQYDAPVVIIRDDDSSS